MSTRVIRKGRRPCPVALVLLVPGLVILSLAGPLNPDRGARRADASGSTPTQTPTPTADPGQELSPEQRAAMAHKEAESQYEKGWNEVEKAREEMHAASKADSTDPAAALASRKSAQKRVRSALDRFRKATELDPEYPEAWNMLGFSYRKTGQLGNAFKAYRTALRLRPDYPEAREYLAEAHLLIGNVARAREELAWLEKNRPDLGKKLAASIALKESGADSLSLHASDW